MGNTKSYHPYIEAKIVFPENILLKYVNSKSFNGESFYYFKPKKNIEIGNIQIEIISKHKSTLDEMQVYQFNFERYNGEEFRNGHEHLFQYSKEMENCTVIFRTDQKFIIKEIVYKISNKYVN